MELLETERLILRELRASDVDRILRYANDETINRYLSFGDIATAEGARKYVEKAMACAAAHPSDGTRRSFKLAILVRPEVEFIGSIWLDITNPAHRRASIGYFVDNNYWGRGYATEAVQALVKYGFETLNLHRIEAMVDTDHQASQLVLQKSGLKREARMREKRQRQGYWADSFLYAIIAGT